MVFPDMQMFKTEKTHINKFPHCEQGLTLGVKWLKQ